MFGSTGTRYTKKLSQYSVVTRLRARWSGFNSQQW